MNRRMWWQRACVLVAGWVLAGCANLGLREPVQVNVVGIEPLSGEGMEMRMSVKVRVQNPNDAALDFDGISIALEKAAQHGVPLGWYDQPVVLPASVPLSTYVPIPAPGVVSKLDSVHGGRPKERLTSAHGKSAAVDGPLDGGVCAQQGRELMGWKFPVGVPTRTHREHDNNESKIALTPSSRS